MRIRTRTLSLLRVAAHGFFLLPIFCLLYGSKLVFWISIPPASIAFVCLILTAVGFLLLLSVFKQGLTIPITSKALFKVLATQLACVFNAVLALLSLIYTIAFAAMGPVQGAWRYETTSLTPHFPTKLPASATNVQYYFYEGFLQGSPYARLSFSLPPAEFADLETNLRKSYSTLSPKEIRSTFINGLPENWTYQEEKFLGPKYVSFLVSPSLELTKRNWNHPHNHGISIDPSRNEVLYWLN